MPRNARPLPLGESLAQAAAEERPAGPRLTNGSRVAVVGGGPAGSFFSVFLLRMADSVGLDLDVEIYEPRSFDRCGPAGCNHCGGIVSESLVQLLATEGINLPANVVQRGLDSYVLHADVGAVRIATPLREKRIAAVFRGNGPRDGAPLEQESFDRYLLDLAVERGARIVRRLVTGIDRPNGRPRLQHAEGHGRTYDLVALATGVNSRLLTTLDASLPEYRPPRTATTYICELALDAERIRRSWGSSMHVFLSASPRIEFAALIPKGNIVTLCVLGHDVDAELVGSLLESPEMRECVPDELRPLTRVCQCAPLINVRGALRPFGERIVMLGDSGVTRLYKDGIGAAYRTAKAAATAAVFEGVSAEVFQRYYWPTCRSINRDNAIGGFVFALNERLRKRRFARRAILRMVAREQVDGPEAQRMSRILWDLFTGSAPYREVLLNTLHPTFVGKLLWNLLVGLLSRGESRRVSHVASRAG